MHDLLTQGQNNQLPVETQNWDHLLPSVSTTTKQTKQKYKSERQERALHSFQFSATSRWLSGWWCSRPSMCLQLVLSTQLPQHEQHSAMPTPGCHSACWHRAQPHGTEASAECCTTAVAQCRTRHQLWWALLPSTLLPSTLYIYYLQTPGWVY